MAINGFLPKCTENALFVRNIFEQYTIHVIMCCNGVIKYVYIKTFCCGTGNCDLNYYKCYNGQLSSKTSHC